MDLEDGEIGEIVLAAPLATSNVSRDMALQMRLQGDQQPVGTETASPSTEPNKAEPEEGEEEDDFDEEGDEERLDDEEAEDDEVEDYEGNSRGPNAAVIESAYTARKRRRKEKKAKKRAKRMGERGGEDGILATKGSMLSRELGAVERPTVARVIVDGQPSQLRNLSEVRQLMQWACGGPVTAPSFVTLQKEEKNLIKRVILLFVGGIDEYSFRSRPDVLPSLARKLGMPVVVQAVSPSALPELTVHEVLTLRANEGIGGPPKPLLASLSRKGVGLADSVSNGSGKSVGEASRSASDGHQAKHNKSGMDKWTAEDYVATMEELRRNEFPLPGVDDSAVSTGSGTGPKFVRTQPRIDALQTPKAQGRLIAMDCEMCKTEDGLEVTRCTLVDSDGAGVM